MDKILEINNLLKNENLDNFTRNKLSFIKNNNFKKNIFDLEEKKIVKNIFMKNIKNKILLWTYYRDRNKTDVNEIINKYKRENLIINYSV
jgi:oligoribonuclease NrnB/cAMP/cGMP phosphodiesterase (DHH superfamily)